MAQEIKTINLGGVNGYLLKAGDGFILVDTGMSTGRATLDRELQSAGCKPGSLKLVILTHGDVDHAGNCVYIREKFATKIAMHPGDAGMVERADMSWNRKAKPDRSSTLGGIIMFISKIMLLFNKQASFDAFTPDLFLEDGQDLATYGLEAKVLHLPGHSKGSIGILTAGGDLICGDLLMNMLKPDAHFMIDDLADFKASLEKLKSSTIHTVYPGHGKSFPFAEVSSRLSLGV